MNMHAYQPRPALDIFMDMSVDDVRAFSEGSTVIRSRLEASDNVVIEPLRGAAPLIWAASGLHHVETSPTNGRQVIEVPSGLGYHVRTDVDKVRYGRLYRSTRNDIVRDSLAAISPEVPGIDVVDEVQLGARLARMANMCAQHARTNGMPLPVRAIAAEDTLRETEHMPRYANLVSGQNPDIVVYPVRAPLIGTDIKELLPQVTYTYDGRQLLDVSVAKNPEAELLFRYIGTMSRHAEVVRDTAYAQSILDPLTTTHSQEDISAWTGALTQAFID